MKEKLIAAIRSVGDSPFKSKTQMIGRVIELTNGLYPYSEIEEEIDNLYPTRFQTPADKAQKLDIGELVFDKGGVKVHWRASKPNWARVMEFHDKFGHPINILPTLDHDSLAFSVRMLFEELVELAEASDKRGTLVKEMVKYLHALDIIDQTFINRDLERYAKDGIKADIVEILDASMDIQYFNDGLKVRTGLWFFNEEASELVHANNMGKIHRDYEHAMETVREKNMEDFTMVELPFGQMILKDSHNKVTKPWDFVKVKLSVLFEKLK